MRCSSCGRDKLGKGLEKEELRVAGIRFFATVEALRCRACGEVSVEAPALEQFERRVAEYLGRNGVCTGEAFKFMRKSIGVRAADLAVLIGVSAETISRWETSKSPVDWAAFVTLSALVEDRLAGRDGTLVRLKALKAPRKAGKVEIKLS